MHTVTFKTPDGAVRVFLPDDLLAGDHISGTVIADPRGNTDAERARRSPALEAQLVSLGGGLSIPVSQGRFSIVVPPYDSAAGPVLSVALTQSPRSKRVLASDLVPVSSTSTVVPAPSGGTLPWNNDWPPLASSGNTVPISGPFDGDATNTSVRVGNTTSVVLAESPRQTICILPAGAPGPVRIEVVEGDSMTTGSIRRVDVQLEATKTLLKTAETTDIAVTVLGLQGCETPVPLQMTAKGNISTPGGNVQNLVIRPGDAPGGEFRITRTLTATAPGEFEFEAEIVYAQPAKPAAASGDVVHVENAPQGGKGLWRIPITHTDDGRAGEVWIEQEKKPALKYCMYIKLGNCEQRGHETYIDGYERVPDPTKKPPSKPTPPPPPPTPAPPAPPAGTGSKSVDTPPPCPEGEIRVTSTEVKEFTVLDPDGGTPIFQCYTNKSGAESAANGLSDYFKDGAKIADEMKKRLPPGVGTLVAGWLIGYIKGGSTVLDAVLASRLRVAGVSIATVAVDLPVKKITATCTTYEICRGGVRTIERKYSESVEHLRLKDNKVADANNQGNGEWEKICDSNSRYDPAKAEAWAKEFLDDHLGALEQAEKDWNAFRDSCK